MNNALSQRNSGVELARFLSITFILGIHLITLVIGLPYTTELINYPTRTITLISFESLFIVCVDIFIVISGWYEIHASSNGLIKLMFQCLFFAIVDALIRYIMGGEISWVKAIITGCFPGWFIAAYIVLYLVSPIINYFVNNGERKRVKILLLTMFGILLLYGWLFNGCSGNRSTFLSGYSATFLIFLYAGVRFLRVHYSELICQLSKSHWLKLFMGLYLLNIIIWILSAYFGVGEVNSKIFLYTSPIVMIQSFSMFMFFLKLRIKNRFVNWLGASSLAIMLLHWSCNGYFFKKMTLDAWESTDGVYCILLLTIVILGISVCAIILDQFRILMFNCIVKSFNLKSIKF